MTEITYTEDMNRFINKHIALDGMGYRDLTPLFNERFGTSLSWDAIRKHGRRIGVSCRVFLSPEQKQWIKDHFYMETTAMQREFNRRFGEDRSYSSMRNQRQKLHAHRNARRTT